MKAEKKDLKRNLVVRAVLGKIGCTLSSPSDEK